jgi:hypothetical protein
MLFKPKEFLSSTREDKSVNTSFTCLKFIMNVFIKCSMCDGVRPAICDSSLPKDTCRQIKNRKSQA